MIDEICKCCGKVFQISSCRKNIIIYCSKKCRYKHFKQSSKTIKKISQSCKKTFKKGRIVWNKGTKGIMKAWNKGKTFPMYSGKNNGNYKGGKHRAGNYIVILNSTHPNAYEGRYILQHRFIIERIIGRYLTTTEEVHHVNNIGTDNRIENLMLFKNKYAHRKFHRIGIVKPEEIIFDGRKLAH